MHEQSQAKKLKAENLLSKIVASWVPAGPSDDQETITEEERVMYRQVGLKMKSYLPLGQLFHLMFDFVLVSQFLFNYILLEIDNFLFNLLTFQVFVEFLMVLLRTCIFIGSTENL